MDTLSEFRQFRAHDHWTRKLLEEHQAQALRSLRDYAYAHSPFYQQFHKGLYEAPLQDLPVLTKAMLMDHFDNLVTDWAIYLRDVQAYTTNHQGDERFLGRYWVHATSGSSGHPGLFIATNTEWLTLVASSLARLSTWAGSKVNLTRRVKMATFASTTFSHTNSW